MNLPATASFVLDLGRFTLPSPDLGYPSDAITDFCGIAYCPLTDRFKIFGGGHASWAGTSVAELQSYAAWELAYQPTPASEITPENLDDHLVFKTTKHPFARHTYSKGFCWSTKIQKFVLVCMANGTPHPYQNTFGREVWGGTIMHYDPITKVWEDTGVPVMQPAAAYCEDPVSGVIFGIWQGGPGGFDVYDPVKKERVASWDWARQELGYAGNCVYYPPNDKFYYFARGEDSKVFEFALDRTNYGVTFTTRPAPWDASQTCRWLDTNQRSQSYDCGYDYDAANQLIVGGLANGKLYGFNPLGNSKGEWTEMEVPGAVHNTFHCHAYSPQDNVHVIIGLGTDNAKHTFVVRWGGGTLPVVPAPDPQVTVNGQPVGSIQEAANIGGDIVLAPGIYTRGGAEFNKPCKIFGKGAHIVGGAIQGKGQWLINVDIEIDGVEMSQARVADQNAASIRHQNGNIKGYNLHIHDSENGYMGPYQYHPITAEFADSVFEKCGTNNGNAHNFYAGKIDLFRLTRVKSRGCILGHSVKSRALRTEVIDCETGDLEGDNSSYNIDTPNGGQLLIKGGIHLQNSADNNHSMVAFGCEPTNPEFYPDSGCTVDGAVFKSINGGNVYTTRSPQIKPKFLNTTAEGADLFDTSMIAAVDTYKTTVKGQPLPNTFEPVLDTPVPPAPVPVEPPVDNVPPPAVDNPPAEPKPVPAPAPQPVQPAFLTIPAGAGATITRGADGSLRIELIGG